MVQEHQGEQPVDLGVVHQNLEPHLDDEIDAVLLAAVDLDVALLPAVAGDRAALGGVLPRRSG